MIVLLCAVLSGGMFYLSQGLDNVWQLAWIAPAPLLWLAYGTAPRWQLFAAGTAAFAAGQIYMAQSYGADLPIVVLAAGLGGGAGFGAAMLFARRAWRTLPMWASLFAFPALATAAEFVIEQISPHGSFGAIGYSQVSFPAAIQIASLFGVSAISFTLWLCANAAAMLARDARGLGMTGLALCAFSLAFGFYRLELPQGATERVAAISDWNARQKSVRKLDYAASLAMAKEYATAASAQAANGARLIVIPETAIAFDPAWRTAAMAPLADAARKARVTIVAGTVSVKPWRNVALAFLPDGSVIDYDKRHLLSPFEDKYRPGTGPGLIGGGRAVAICKDMDFPATLRGDAQHGIGLIAVPANDFVKDDWIHARIAVMRGVEDGFAVVRSAFNGLETISDAQGRILASARTYDRPGLTAIHADVPAGAGPTLYLRIGGLFAWLCVALSAVLVAAPRLRRLRPE